MKVLVFSRTILRADLAPGIAGAVKLLGKTAEVVSIPVEDFRQIHEKLESMDPAFVLIDGEYAQGDKELIAELNRLSPADVRLSLMDPGKKSPASIGILQQVAMFRKNVLILFFIDLPSPMLTSALKDIGASVIGNLNVAGETQRVISELAHHGKKAIHHGKEFISIIEAGLDRLAT